MGELKDNVYTNKSLDIKIDPGSGWKDRTKAKRDSIIKYIDAVTDDTFKNDENFRKTLEEHYDLTLVNWESTVAGQIELTIKSTGTGVESDLKEYVNSAYESAEQTYGDDYKFSKPANIELVGVEWYGYTFEMEVLDYTIVTGSYMHKYGDYTATFTISVSDMDGGSFKDVLKTIGTI